MGRGGGPARGTSGGSAFLFGEVVRKRLRSRNDAGDVGVDPRGAVDLGLRLLALDALRRLLAGTFLPGDLLLALCERRSAFVGHNRRSRSVAGQRALGKTPNGSTKARVLTRRRDALRRDAPAPA